MSCGSSGYNASSGQSMICVIIISVLLFKDAVVAEQQHDEAIVEEKTGNFNTEHGYFRKMMTSNGTSNKQQTEQKREPYVFRWYDGKREEGDRLSVTPWDDYDFNGAKDYEYQLRYNSRGCRINYIQVRLIIVIIIII